MDRDPHIFVIACLQHEIETELQVASYFFAGTNTLFILDDCAASKDVKGRTGQLVNLGFSARHEGISVWVLTQQITSIAKAYRDNIAAVVLAREAKKQAQAASASNTTASASNTTVSVSNTTTATASDNNNLSLVTVLGIVGLIASVMGVYYQREAIRARLNPAPPAQPAPAPTPAPSRIPVKRGIKEME